MKLVYVCRNCTLLGGQSRIAWEVATRAAHDGQEVHLVARRLPKNTPLQGIVPHRVFQLPSFVGEWHRFRSFMWSSGRRSGQLAGPDGIIHGFGDNDHQHIMSLGNVDWNYGRHLPGRVPDKTAVHVKTRALLNPALRFLVLCSRLMRQDVLDLIPGFDPSKFKVIYPGVDAGRFSRHSRESIRARLAGEFNIDPKAFWIVTAAGGDFEKRNAATLAQALLKLNRRPEWKMILIGGRKDQIPWPRELEDRTYFLGRLDDIGTVLPGCDMMAYPAWYDEFALVCLEAMASGLPLAVSRRVGASEVLPQSNQDNGILEDPGDADKLSSLIEKMIDAEDLRKRIAADNRRQAQNLTWDNSYRQYKELYLQVKDSLSLTKAGSGPILS
jgi:glycosyltransferase involved in cell wall biosynthesis